VLPPPPPPAAFAAARTEVRWEPKYMGSGLRGASDATDPPASTCASAHPNKNQSTNQPVNPTFCLPQVQPLPPPPRGLRSRPAQRSYGSGVVLSLRGGYGAPLLKQLISYIQPFNQSSNQSTRKTPTFCIPQVRQRPPYGRSRPFSD